MFWNKKWYFEISLNLKQKQNHVLAIVIDLSSNSRSLQAWYKLLPDCVALFDLQF